MVRKDGSRPLGPKETIEKSVCKVGFCHFEESSYRVSDFRRFRLAWRPKFKVFFQKYDYDFICTNYGGDHSDYMGVAIAYPRSRFEMKDGKIFRARESVEWKRIWKKRSSSDSSKKWNLATSSLILTAAAAFALDLDSKTKTLVTTGLLGSLGICLARSFGLVDKPAPRPKQTALEIAKGRYNRQIIVTLRDRTYSVIWESVCITCLVCFGILRSWWFMRLCVRVRWVNMQRSESLGLTFCAVTSTSNPTVFRIKWLRKVRSRSRMMNIQSYPRRRNGLRTMILWKWTLRMRCT